MFSEITIDLSRAPKERWTLSTHQAEQARELLLSYKSDLGFSSSMCSMVFDAAESVVRPDHWAELRSLADSLDVPMRDVVVCNLYYDLLKVVLGCTAFAAEAKGTILHARNLDWWTENAALSRTTTVCKFVGAPAGDFTTIGWPGFAGAFSGVAPGRFAVTLNAVLSDEPMQFSMPIVFLLRAVLEKATSFHQAATILADTPIPCDCLLLLSGTGSGQMMVIERTPTRHAMRKAVGGFVAVTNDYHSLRTDAAGSPNELLRTSCGRFNRIESLLLGQSALDSDRCFAYLSDAEVVMSITVQQMVFCAATGQFWVRSPTNLS
jgi:hypothetical protein